jgi:hypothetical protein
MKSRSFGVITILMALTQFMLSQQSKGEEPLWQMSIERIAFSGSTIEDAAKAVVEAFKKQYPKDDRLSGYIVAGSDDLIRNSVVSADLRNIPLGELCQQVAESAGWRFTLQSKSVCFYPGGSGYFTTATQVLAITANVVADLGLKQGWGMEDLLKELKERKIEVAAFDAVNLKKFEDVTYLVVEGDREEVETLRSFWRLMGRKRVK